VVQTQWNDYRIYRRSSAGCAFNAKIYEIDELVDQFAFGIKKHPNSLETFYVGPGPIFPQRQSLYL
jgi:hypothetical protein